MRMSETLNSERQRSGRYPLGTGHLFNMRKNSLIICYYPCMQVTSDHTLPSGIDKSWRIAVIHSTYYEEEIDALIKGVTEVLTAAGIPEGNISLHPAAGSFEIPLLGGAVAKAKKADAMIGLGIIVEGETQHARLLAEQTARGIMDVQLQYGIPFAFEVLYVKSLKQAQERTHGERNKGREAARAVLHSLSELKRIRG